MESQAQEHQAKMRRLMDTGITAAPEDVHWAEALLLHAGGSDDAALGLLARLYEELPARPVLIAHDPAAAGALVAIALAAGAAGHASRVVAAARVLAERNPGSHSAAGAVAHAEGLLYGDPAKLRLAVREFRSTPRPLALAAALEDAVRAGQAEEGWYDEAVAIVTGCGALGSRRRLEQRRLEHRPGAVTPPAPAPPLCLPQLSPAERPVALAVARGLTNIEAARELYLSRHTVDSHLRKIFNKLGVSRRAELAALVARECGGNP
jgi:DNA-binding CsgD family transcriptional regulator